MRNRFSFVAGWAVLLHAPGIAAPLTAQEGDLPAQPPPIPRAFIGAKIIPIGAPEIENGTLLIRGDRIIAVGPVDQVRIPDDAWQVDVRGKVIMPGLGRYPQPHRRRLGRRLQLSDSTGRPYSRFDQRSRQRLSQGAGRWPYHAQRDARLRAPALWADDLHEEQARSYNRGCGHS